MRSESQGVATIDQLPVAFDEFAIPGRVLADPFETVPVARGAEHHPVAFRWGQVGVLVPRRFEPGRVGFVQGTRCLKRLEPLAVVPDNTRHFFGRYRVVQRPHRRERVLPRRWRGLLHQGQCIALFGGRVQRAREAPEHGQYRQQREECDAKPFRPLSEIRHVPVFTCKPVSTLPERLRRKRAGVLARWRSR